MTDENDLVTVIVPVYNVQNYLDRCLESIVNQTYKNIEILLINDGSTDKSGQICESWENKDKRIRYICKDNEGLGPTRNLGIIEAKGKYIMCVDSDDWVDAAFVEKLYRAINEADADMAECDFWREVISSGLKYVTRVSDMVGRDMSKEERIVYGNVSMWKMITRKALWTENLIKQPKLPGEDLAVYALIVACSKRIANVKEPLYHYQKGRPGSISSSVENIEGFIQSMQYLLKEFQQQNIFYRWQDILRKQLLRWTSRLLVPIINEISVQEYHRLEKLFLQLLKHNFSEISSATMLTLGGYNLSKIIQNTNALENPYARFSFQSIASIMGDFQATAPQHNNPYREFMLRREFNREFINYLSSEKPDFIIIDFIEERHALLCVQNSIYTYSDALQESDFTMQGEILAINTEETWEIWQDSCLRFIALLEENFKANHVVLVENLLAERHGDIHGTCEFENLDEIRKANEWIKKCYAFFKENMSGIQTINLTNHELYFADDNYEYGCYPWHLNTLINIEIGKRIRIEE